MTLANTMEPAQSSAQPGASDSLQVQAPADASTDMDTHTSRPAPENTGMSSTNAVGDKKLSSVEATKQQSQGKRGSRGTSETSSTNGSGQRRKRKEETPYDQRHKRKWEQYIDGEDPVHGSMTHRRLVRELDEQKAESIEMDY